MHYIGVIFAGEDVTCAAHVGGQLIHLSKTPIDYRPTHSLITQVANHKVIRLGFSVFAELKINTTNPESFLLQASNKMSTDKATSATDQSSFHQ